jgi:hypothetical protein
VNSACYPGMWVRSDTRVLCSLLQFLALYTLIYTCTTCTKYTCIACQDIRIYGAIYRMQTSYNTAFTDDAEPRRADGNPASSPSYRLWKPANYSPGVSIGARDPQSAEISSLTTELERPALSSFTPEIGSIFFSLASTVLFDRLIRGCRLQWVLSEESRPSVAQGMSIWN